MNKFKYHYEIDQDVILLPGKLYGKLGNKNINFVFDPGAYKTIISTELTDSLGYGLNKESKKISTGSVIGTERGYTIIVRKISIFYFEFKNIEIACFDLPKQYKVRIIPGEILCDIIRRDRKGKDPPLGIPFEHHLQKGLIEHIHLCLKFFISFLLKLSAINDTAIPVMRRNRQIKGDISKRGLKSHPGRHIDIEQKFLKGLLDLSVT
jgi:hypothetical protein